MMFRKLGLKRLVLLLACVGLVGSLFAAPAPAKKHRKSACQKLRGHDFAPSRSLKLVAKRVNSIETDLVGCQLPRGEARIFAIRLAGDTSDFTVHDVAGRWALVSARTDSRYTSEQRAWVFDIVKGRVLYTIQRWTCPVGQSTCKPRPLPLVKGSLKPYGKAAAAFSDGQTTSIAGFGTNGRRKSFDSGSAGELPAGSLTLHDEVASWLHSGQHRQGALP
ncbi:MAG: hypothetical protein QOH76_936 [Thermoleophilaceae bacterium]|nr:hypothetical protein [Thermoleophilaceae bacterium]